LLQENINTVKLLDCEDASNNVELVEKKDETEEDRIIREALLI